MKSAMAVGAPRPAFQSQLSSYFDVVNSLATIRDEEEGASGYRKHPMLVPALGSAVCCSSVPCCGTVCGEKN